MSRWAVMDLGAMKNEVRGLQAWPLRWKRESRVMSDSQQITARLVEFARKSRKGGNASTELDQGLDQSWHSEA
jgi:hypothetical protein